jgi:WD40 repeat protein
LPKLIRKIDPKDGVWEVSVSRMNLPILGTASADHTAIVWGMHSGRPLLQYTGHLGSVNAIRYGFYETVPAVNFGQKQIKIQYMNAYKSWLFSATKIQEKCF